MDNNAGRLQLISMGDIDSFTKDPQITFFNKEIRRYTNFSVEMKEVVIDSNPEYNQDFHVIIPTYGDLINKCFLEVSIPITSITDSYITNDEYITDKNNRLETLNTKVNKWLKEYNELKDFSNIQIIFYNTLIKYLNSKNITFNLIKSELGVIQQTYSDVLETTVFKIDEDLKDKVDIIGYVDSLNVTFTDTDDLDNNELTQATFKSNITELYDYNIEYLTYYYSNYIYYKNKYDETNTGTINYAWCQDLGNNYFTDFTTEIGGDVIQTYTNDYLKFYMSHHLSDEEVENYDVLIGNKDYVNDLETDKKTIKLYVPLVFWFNESYQNSLPLVSLRHSSVKITTKINDIRRLLYFEDYSKQYEDILKLEYPYSEHTITNGYPSELSGLSGNIVKKDYMSREKIFIYYCQYITKNLLQYQYPDLDSDDLDYLFTTYSSDGTNLTKQEWIKFRLAIENDSNLDAISKIINTYNHYEYADYNYLRNQFGSPEIKFYCNFIRLGDYERHKFASNKIEYIISTTNTIVNTLSNKTIRELYYTSELNLLKPTKDIYWAFKPLVNTYGLSDSDKKNPSEYNKYSIVDYDILTDMNILMEGQKIVNTDIYNFKLYEVANKYKYLTNYSDLNFYYYSFSLDPENDDNSVTTNGFVNMNSIKNKSINFRFNTNFISEYYNSSFNTNQFEMELVVISRTYNVLIFNKGIGRLLFSS